MKNKPSLNTSCFNQRSISTLNQYYNSVNEMMCIKDTVLNKIKKIEHDSVFSCIELEKNNKILHDEFVFMNPKNKNKTLNVLTIPQKLNSQNTNKSKTSSETFNNDILFSRGFMSLDNYYKFIKNNLNKIHNQQSEGKKINLQLNEKNKSKKHEKKIYKRNMFKAYNTEVKSFLPVLQKRNNKSPINYVLLNKDIKYQVKRSSINYKKNKIKEQNFLKFNDYDYTNILDLFK